MLTNVYNLPESIVRAVTNDPYTRGNSDISVTQLITPPYQRRLKEVVEPIEDVSDRLYSLYGQMGHTLLERAGIDEGLHVEERLYKDVNGWKVSGQFDLYDNETLYDYKFTSTWSVRGDVKSEWIKQLNLLRVLAEANGMTVNKLRIIAMLRDFSKAQAKRDQGYPKHPIVAVDIPVWDLSEAEAYMEERVKAHQEESPPSCSDEDRWMTQHCWALMKEGRKSAVKLYYSEEEAEAACQEAGKKHSVVHRPGEPKRCLEYCNVAHECPQMKAEVPF
jgi:hypothetical protein